MEADVSLANQEAVTKYDSDAAKVGDLIKAVQAANGPHDPVGPIERRRHASEATTGASVRVVEQPRPHAGLVELYWYVSGTNR